MIRFEFGDIILVPFPFTDQTAVKKRPAVIVSSPAYNSARPDLIIMAVTSQIKSSDAFGEMMVSQWQSAGLIKPSAIKPVITTIEKELVIKSLGRLQPADRKMLADGLSLILG